jgi:LysM repeat protein
VAGGPASVVHASVQSATADARTVDNAGSTAPHGASVHVVKPGETLLRIARATGVSVARLQAANGLPKAAVLRPGQRLTVPHVPPSAAAGAGAVSTAP